MTLNEKQWIEEDTAKIFLTLYNQQMGTAFEIIELGDAPDITCLDIITGRKLCLEISLLPDLRDDIPYLKGITPKPISPTTKTTVVSFFNDVAPNLKEEIKKKLLSSYGADTALVLRQVNIAWEVREWEYLASRVLSEVLHGKEKNYGAGIWVICTDNSTWPASDAIFCLNKPACDVR